MTAKEWKDALTLMRIHQMIDVPGAVQDIEDDTPIYIYSTIHLFVTAGDIRKLLKEYQENTEYEQHVIQGTKHTDEESDGVKKEEQGETTEETVYTDVIK